MPLEEFNNPLLLSGPIKYHHIFHIHLETKNMNLSRYIKKSIALQVRNCRLFPIINTFQNLLLKVNRPPTHIAGVGLYFVGIGF
ncbi:hypothetical protein D3C85_810170 [compost metagenome]